jgi:hypothetical protein
MDIEVLNFLRSEKDFQLFVPFGLLLRVEGIAVDLGSSGVIFVRARSIDRLEPGCPTLSLLVF